MFFKYVTASDLFLLKLFNHRIKCRILDIIMPALTYLGSSFFTLSFCLAAALFPKRYTHVLGKRAFFSLILATAIAQIIKISVSRIRPFIKIPNLNIKKIGIDQYSFPSGHTTAAFSLAVSTGLVFSGLTVACITLAALVGISRMYLGVHYPSDVLAGVFLGTTCSLLMYFLI